MLKKEHSQINSKSIPNMRKSSLITMSEQHLHESTRLPHVALSIESNRRK